MANNRSSVGSVVRDIYGTTESTIDSVVSDVSYGRIPNEKVDRKTNGTYDANQRFSAPRYTGSDEHGNGTNFSEAELERRFPEYYAQTRLGIDVRRDPVTGSPYAAEFYGSGGGRTTIAENSFSLPSWLIPAVGIYIGILLLIRLFKKP